MVKSESSEERRKRGSDIMNFRLSDPERERLQRLRERLQGRESKHVEVTYKRVFLEALDALEAKLDKLERDRERSR